MLFSDVCRPLGAVLTCNQLATELLETLKTASTSKVHRNTYYAAALHTRIAKAC